MVTSAIALTPNPMRMQNPVKQSHSGCSSYRSKCCRRGSTSLNYGEPNSSFMINEFAKSEELSEIVGLANQAMPKRPDGVIVVAKYTSVAPECTATEGGYESLARNNPDTVFLRAFQEYTGGNTLFAEQGVSVTPTFDIYFKGNRVGRVEGNAENEVQGWIARYGFVVSTTDLFSEEANDKATREALAWKGKEGKGLSTPGTTNRFVPGYDWDKDRGFFDDLGDKAQEEWESMYENWTPNIDDE